MLGYPGWPLTCLVLAVAAGGVWATTAYTLDSGEIVAAIVGFLILVVWGVRVVVGTITTRRAGGRPAWRVVLTLVAFGGAVVLALSGIPLELRFAASRDDLQRAADRALAGEPVAPGRIGWYGVDDVRVVGDTVLFELGDCFLATCGVAYAGDGRPDPVSEVRYERLDGRWFHYVESF